MSATMQSNDVNKGKSKSTKVASVQSKPGCFLPLPGKKKSYPDVKPRVDCCNKAAKLNDERVCARLEKLLEGNKDKDSRREICCEESLNYIFEQPNHQY